MARATCRSNQQDRAQATVRPVALGLQPPAPVTPRGQPRLPVASLDEPVQLVERPTIPRRQGGAVGPTLLLHHVSRTTGEVPSGQGFATVAVASVTVSGLSAFLTFMRT